MATWMRLQENLARGEIPAYEMVEGPILLVGGALLLTPGFFTDAIGFACLLPSIRRKIAQVIIEKQLVGAAGSNRQAQPKEPDIIEGEFRKED